MLLTYKYATIDDDPKKPELRPFQRGWLSFAGSGPNSRSVQMFFTLGSDVRLVWVHIDLSALYRSRYQFTIVQIGALSP